jgi:hypothetical protein
LRAVTIAAQGWRPTAKAVAAQKGIPLAVRLRREKIYPFKEIVHKQPREWLIKNLSEGADDYPVNVAMLMKNVIWQIRTRIVRGEEDPIEGLLRSFWYKFIKPPLARAGSLNPRVDQYSQMIGTFVKLVQGCGFMRYKDMGFIDDNRNDRKIGINNHVILFAEKAGHYPLLQKIAEETDVTILSLGGQPSQLSAEYFVDEMKGRGIDVRKSFYTFSLVDYDPSGWIIKDAFLADLQFLGLKHIRHEDLILPKIFSEEEIELNKFPPPSSPGQDPKNEKWLERSGGINGELYGLEADAAPFERIKKLFEAKTKDLRDSTEAIRRGRAFLALSGALEEYILAQQP